MFYRRHRSILQRSKRGGYLTAFKIPRALIFKRDGLWLLDQTLLPSKVVYRRCGSARAVAEAIRRLRVRGAPWIGIAAGYGLALEGLRLKDSSLRSGLMRAGELLISARPTAVNLAWAVRLILRLVDDRNLSIPELRKAILDEAMAIERMEAERSFSIARIGARLIKVNARILTICNTGTLASPGLGTALGVVFQAAQEGKSPFVYVCETRPLWQGARLTTWELTRAGIDFKLIVDSAAATVIEECDLVLVGADRIARNGDTANKIGTRMLALLASVAKKPFYVVAPSSTFDLSIRTGKEIVIEERDGDEIRRCGKRLIAPAESRVFNPAFDITPARYIRGFVTESGILKPPFSDSIVFRGRFIRW